LDGRQTGIQIRRKHGLAHPVAGAEPTYLRRIQSLDRLQTEQVELPHGAGIQDAGLVQAFRCLVHGLQNLSCHFHYTSISIS
jgi:hypothetical protein